MKIFCASIDLHWDDLKFYQLFKSLGL